MKTYKLFGVIVALLWTPCVFAQLTIIQNKNGKSKIALKLPESKVIPASSLVKMVSLATPFKKPEAVHLDLEAQFQEMKDQCPLTQPEKFALHLEGERHTTSLVRLEWKTTNNDNGYQFILERSLGDSTHFDAINEVWVESGEELKSTYRLPDGNSYNDISYYRLRLALRTGDHLYSNIAAVKGYDNRSFFVYPNPVVSMATVNFIAREAGEAVLKIYDAAGRLVAQEFVGVEKGNNQKYININRLLRGSYTVRLEIAKQTSEVSKFIKN